MTDDATAVPVYRDGRFNVDIRVFMLSITVAMCGAFLAGVTMGPSELIKTGAQSSPFPLDLPTDVDADSLKHSPSGQHLLVDIAYVDATFLNSEERLTEAMVQTVKESGLTMLSYHCHELQPAGISCVGVLLESHISFHTWPEEGVITLDLFTSDEVPLLPQAVNAMERLFGIPGSGAAEKVRVKWSHELRGFRPQQHKSSNVIDSYSDLSTIILSPLDVHNKKQLYSNMTQYHRIDIWDILDLNEGPSNEEGLHLGFSEGDPRWENPDFAIPDRCTFIDGYLQRRSNEDLETHEGLVHPAMFAHPDPQKVAIVGGREGGALREVLKHNTVQSATLIEKDEELVKISQKYYPKMSDCSDLVGRAHNCFGDELARVHFEDARNYFKSHYSSPGPTSALLDVIIVDDQDPRNAPEMYTDEDFVSSMVKALSPEGVMVFLAGRAPDIEDPRGDAGIFHVREQLINQLESNPEIQALLVYEEPRSGYNEPNAMLLACKSANCRSRWYARSDQVDFAIYERIVQTHSKKRALSYYDGTTQYAYQVPPKAWETVYCRREPTPFECAYLHLDPKQELHDLDLDEESNSSFRIETNSKMVTQETGEEEEETEARVFAKVNIPMGSYIMPHHLASSLVVTGRNLEGLNKNLNVGGGPVAVIEDLLEFIDDYGHESHLEGMANHIVEIGGSVLIRQVEDPDEANVGQWVPPHPSGKNPVFSPVYERHRMSFDVFIVATKDIPAGAEVLRHIGLWG